MVLSGKRDRAMQKTSLRVDIILFLVMTVAQNAEYGE